MTELEVRGVSKRLGDHPAVDDVSFTVAAGEFFVLLGTSGSGKSTLLRLICGLETPDRGVIMVGGREIQALPPRQRNLGMVFQEYGLYPSMDVRGNIAYGLEARGGLDKAEIRSRVERAAGRLGLTDLLGQAPQDLSGGEQQRVALARAMVKDADAFLYDEPMSNLDPKLRHQARRDVLAVHREQGRPSVYVTHDQSEAFAMADRVAIMSHGVLQQVASPDELLAAPSNAFVARFVGSPPMNLLPRGERLAGFRPEALRPAANGSGEIAGTVITVEEGLVELTVRFAASDGTELLAVLDDDLDAEPGDHVSFDLAGPIRWFDRATERAIGDD
ncbi:ABC transporter ATP-binding protein [Microlunatus sp. GCM10028923]|uniref:ABC transporter ATP-binding protein n=1 Tax=Microlunatus sp. GCM10028923 TaxID=3273400 RepID=UPI00360DB277